MKVPSIFVDQQQVERVLGSFHWPCIRSGILPAKVMRFPKKIPFEILEIERSSSACWEETWGSRRGAPSMTADGQFRHGFDLKELWAEFLIGMENSVVGEKVSRSDQKSLYFESVEKLDVNSGTELTPREDYFSFSLLGTYGTRRRKLKRRQGKVVVPSISNALNWWFQRSRSPSTGD